MNEDPSEIKRNRFLSINLVLVFIFIACLLGAIVAYRILNAPEPTAKPAPTSTPRPTAVPSATTTPSITSTVTNTSRPSLTPTITQTPTGMLQRLPDLRHWFHSDLPWKVRFTAFTSGRQKMQTGWSL